MQYTAGMIQTTVPIHNEYTSHKKELLRKVESRLVIIECAGYSFRQLFLC